MNEKRDLANELGVDRQGLWRSSNPFGNLADLLAGPATGLILVSVLVLMLILPLLAIPLSLGTGCYLLWLAGKRYRLPMRVPKSWKGLDYSDNKPGSSTRYKKAEGLLFLGNDDDGRELWISNSDARRHKFVLGTTGSGKTEYLLGNIVQPMAWGSGFLFIDGKGTPEFYARIWTLAKRFGREDDVRLINFTGVSGEGAGDADALAGSLGSQSNTLNPFSFGTADQLIQMITSLMSSGGSGTDMWKDRAVNLMATLVRGLVEMRDRQEILMDVQSIRDYMPFGNGVPGGAVPSEPPPGMGAPGRKKEEPVPTLADISPAQWDAIRQDKSAGALYLRCLNNEFSESTQLAFSGFFDSLPGFSLTKLLQSKEQSTTTMDQYGYLTMQLTKPLGTMADDYAHIFRTPLAEVNMEDVVYRRRILVVLLPALQKAPSETRNLGKIIVSMAKTMMGSASGSKVSGTRREIIESSPTRSNAPFLAVFDEAGYYLVEGMDVMAAQARSLGFSMIIGAQDVQAMRADNRQTADSVIANTFLTAIGATVDANDSLDFIRKKVGVEKVLQTTGMERVSGLFGTSYKEGGLSYSDVERLQVDELRNLAEGEFYFVFRDRVIRGRSFFVGSDFHHEIEKNAFIPIRGPYDRHSPPQSSGNGASINLPPTAGEEVSRELVQGLKLVHSGFFSPSEKETFSLSTNLLKLAIHGSRQPLPEVCSSPLFTTYLSLFLAQADKIDKSRETPSPDQMDDRDVSDLVNHDPVQPTDPRADDQSVARMETPEAGDSTTPGPSTEEDIYGEALDGILPSAPAIAKPVPVYRTDPFITERVVGEGPAGAGPSPGITPSEEQVEDTIPLDELAYLTEIYSRPAASTEKETVANEE
ncbi:MAG: hypothetical protein OXH65_02945 [Paracoccaceae bacterium]|nr:hypothetical protein [Paracoccaceae bacterium]